MEREPPHGFCPEGPCPRAWRGHDFRLFFQVGHGSGILDSLAFHDISPVGDFRGELDILLGEEDA
jgi:hypothetical protein